MVRKPAEDAADAERIGDRLAQAISLRNVEVRDGRRLVAADLHHQDDEVRAAQRFAPIERGFDPDVLKA